MVDTSFGIDEFVEVVQGAEKVSGHGPHNELHSIQMNRIELETEALKLPVADRARLAEALLESLDILSDEEHQRLWTEEAMRRDAELDADPSRGRPAAEVFHNARARVR